MLAASLLQGVPALSGFTIGCPLVSLRSETKAKIIIATVIARKKDPFRSKAEQNMLYGKRQRNEAKDK